MPVTVDSPHAPRLLTAAAALLLCVPVLAACSTPGSGPPTATLTAGGSDCELPVLTVTPAEVAPGEKVKLSGKWFVYGCAGQPGQEPRVDMGASFIDGAGTGEPIGLVDATGSDGVVDAEVTIPANAVDGPGRIILGPSGPVQVTVKR